MNVTDKPSFFVKLRDYDWLLSDIEKYGHANWVEEETALDDFLEFCKAEYPNIVLEYCMKCDFTLGDLRKDAIGHNIEETLGIRKVIFLEDGLSMEIIRPTTFRSKVEDAIESGICKYVKCPTCGCNLDQIGG